MASPSRFTKLGSTNLKNKTDAYMEAVQFPIVAVAADTAQTVDVKTPSESMQVYSAYIQINTPESSATVTTVSVGVTGANNGAAVIADAAVDSAGVAGKPVTEAIKTTPLTKFTYTLADSDFEELDAVCIVHYVGIDEK